MTDGRPAGQDHGLVCTVTTLWDSLDNARRFVSRNLAAGTDHMFIFLDAPAPGVREHLEGFDQVTVVRTDRDYWQGRRSRSLNGRQLANANLVNYLLSPFGEVRWLFHIDGDESLDIDRAELLASRAPAVRLSVLESVSRAHWEGPVDTFKRTPTQEELERLARLGVIARPRLREYFHGTPRGKVGLQPTVDLRLGIHEVWDRAGNRMEAQSSPAWHVLHYECWSGEEFLRKWASPMANRRAAFNGRRSDLRVTAILDDSSIDGPAREERLLELFDAAVADDVPALEEAGLLVTPRAELHSHEPRGLGAQREGVHRLLEHFLAADRRYFLSPKQQRHPRELFEELRGTGLDADLDARLTAVLARPPGPAVPYPAAPHSPSTGAAGSAVSGS